MTGVRIETGQLGGSPLSRLAQAGEAPTEWYPARPTSPEGWRGRIESVRATTTRGWASALGEALRVTPGSRAASRLAAVADRSGIVVTTGQQAGLFGGPVYTWAKALSALALADAIEAVTGVPVAPLFWAATDDSDLAEASWTIVNGPDGPERLDLGAIAPEGTRVADVPLPDMTGLLERLAAACGSAADQAPLAIVRESWKAGSTVGAAYVAQLRAVLEPLGVAVLDAAHPAVSRAAHPVLVRALHERERVAGRLGDRARELRARGFTPQVPEMGDLTLVFRRDGGRRGRVRRAEGAVAAAAAEAGSLSPNVLLRPVVERAILPTVAYVAGPAELAYFAQVSAVADALALDRPLAVPRWSVTLVEPDVDRVLARHGVDREELADPHAVESRLARSHWPQAVADGVERLRGDLARGVAGLRDVLATEEALLPPAVVDGAARGIDWRLRRLERRITAAVKGREAAMMRDLRLARGALYPLGLRQERALNLVPLLARHGTGLLERMGEGAGAHARALVGGEAVVGTVP